MNEYQNSCGTEGMQHKVPQNNSVAPMSAMAVAGFVLGVIALLTSFLPIINNISFIFALLGGIFAIVGLVVASRQTRRGKGLAVAALVLSVVAVALVLATQSLYSTALNQAISDPSSSSHPASEQVQATSGEATTESSKYAVSIGEGIAGTDYAGKKALVVTFTFTNNSSKAQSFLVTISAKAFQNGVELDSAIGAVSDSQGVMNEIKPGATTTVQQAYVLDDESEVSVECAQFMSSNGDILAKKTFSVV